MHTIVSAYYKIPSKQPHSFYLPFLFRWFRSITAPVIFFTQKETHEEFKALGIIGSNIKIIELELSELNAWKKWGREFWDRQKLRDIEHYHTPEVAAIWFEKKEFVIRAMEHTDAETFIWCDAGCIRDDNHANAAKDFGKRGIDLNDNKIHLQYVRNQPMKKFYVFPEYRFAGAIIAGNRYAWKQHSKLYDLVLKYYDENGICGNSDQYIMQTCADRIPILYNLHSFSRNDTISYWFFFIAEL